MIILSVAWDMFDEINNEGVASFNGASIAVRQICECIGRKVESYVLIGNKPEKTRRLDSINIIGTDNALSFKRSDKNIKKWQSILLEIFKQSLAEIRPDFIFFHAPGEFVINCAEFCDMIGYPYAIVYHGLGSFDGKKYILTEWEEKSFELNSQTCIAVSHGTKQRILIKTEKVDEKKILIIPNGTEFQGMIDDKYYQNCLVNSLPFSDRKILLCVGTIHPVKNQKQLVRAFSLLPKNLKKRIGAIFCGKDPIKTPGREELHNYIIEYGLAKDMVDVGVLDREQMRSLYYNADGLVQPSIVEGLSLAVLEMISYGKPIIMFENGSEYELNNSNVSIIVKDRTDQALANAIVEWYERKWDYNKIKSFSAYFSMERVAEDYIRIAEDNKR